MPDEKLIITLDQQELISNISVAIAATSRLVASLKGVVNSCIDNEYIHDTHKLVNMIELMQTQREILSELRDRVIPAESEEE